ncbi:hypothetical protein SERLADRAFT_388062, partial [Serpula lacrymans var. lacrymans S7.9]
MERLNIIAFDLEQKNKKSSKWDPRKIMNIYYENCKFAKESLEVLNLAKVS